MAVPTLQEQAIEFHPDALRPGFQWTMSVPQQWAVLETHPAKWKVRIDRIIEDYFLGKRLRAAEKRILRAQLEQTVGAAQKNKILLVLLMPGATDDGEVAACTILVRWQSSSPQMASLASVDAAFGTSKSLERRSESGHGAYALFSEETKVGPVTERRSLWNTQAFVPISATPWTLVVSGNAPSEDLGETIRDMVIHMADSVRAYPNVTEPLLADTDATDATDQSGGEESGDEVEKETSPGEPGDLMASESGAVRRGEE